MLRVEAEPHHVPLRITARMGEPVVTYGDGLHLDGILSYGAMLADPETAASLPHISGPTAHDWPLPLARWIVGDEWGWCASAAHADWLVRSKAEVRKRTPTAEMTRLTRDRTVNVASGPFKPQDKAFPTLMALEVEWYALGAADGVRRLLDLVTHVGKLSAHGYGRVLEWEVAEAAEDWSIERDGELTRRMPAALRPHAAPGRGGLRAPYHHRSRMGACVEPDFGGLAP